MNPGLMCTSTCTNGSSLMTMNFVHLAGLDDENLAAPCLEFLSVNDVARASTDDELDLVVGVPVRAGPGSLAAIEQER